MIEQLPPSAPGIISVTVSGKLWHEDISNTLPLIEAAGASQRKCRLPIVFSNFHGWNTQSKRLISLSPTCTVDEIGDAEDFMARGRGGMITGRMTAVNTKGAAA